MRAQLILSMRSVALRLVPAACALALSCAACSSHAPSVDGGGLEQPTPPALLDAEPPIFAVFVAGDRATGVPGTRFKLQARVDANDAALRTHTWSANGQVVASGPSAELSFAQPGDYLVEVAVEDEQGRVAADGILLKVFDPSASSASPPAAIAPSSGAPGRFVQIRAPSLMDPAAHIAVVVGDRPPVEPFRPALGTANLLIPLDAATMLSSPALIRVRVLADGVEREGFDFMLEPRPMLQVAPGALARAWLDAGPSALSAIEPSVIELLAEIPAPLAAEERALPVAMLRLAKARWEQVRAASLPLLDALDEASLTALDNVLVANGASDIELGQLQTKAGQLLTSLNARDEIIDLACKFHDLMAGLQRAIDALGQGASLLPFLGLELAGSAITPAMVGMANVITNLGLAGDLLGEVDKLVPRVQDVLEVTATPSALTSEREKAVIRVTAHLTADADLCRDALDKLLDRLIKEETSRLLLAVPLPRLAKIVTRHSFLNFGEPGKVETLREIQGYLRDAMAQILGFILDAAGLDDLLAQAKGKICAIDTASGLRLQPDSAILSTTPSSAGTFLNLQEEAIDFYCSLNTRGQVTLRADRACGKTRLSGETTLTCFQAPCTENALGSLVLNPVLGQQLLRDSACGFVKEKLETRTVNVSFTNTDPMRTIAIAAVGLFESDRQDLPGAPCENPGSFASVQDCVKGVTYGCNAPPGLFIGPGQTASIPVTYNCLFEDLFPSSGSCGDRQLDTQRGRLLVQAVYCDDYNNAQNAFCGAVHEQMVKLGLPSPLWPHFELTTCANVLRQVAARP